MTTARELVAETKRHLLSGQREARNRLTAPITSNVTTVTLEFATGLPVAGSYLEIDLEVLYVWSITGQVATVERGQLGSVATSHLAGAAATVNPKFPDFAILKALNDDLVDLASPINGLFAVRSVDLTASATGGSYDLTSATDLLEVLSVRHRLPGLPDSWATITNYELSQSAGSDFASGYSLDITDALTPGRAVRVLYKAAFSPLTSLADDVETVTGMPDWMMSLPPLGAAIALVAPREIRRNTLEQGDTRRGEEVPAGAIAGSIRPLMMVRQTRINAASARLAQMYPDRGFLPAQAVW